MKVDPWLDSECLLPGSNWKNAIDESIRKSDFFVAIISNNSVTKRGYVQKELKIALDVLNEIQSNDIFIIPLRLNECEVQESSLKSLHYVDLFPSWSDGLNKVRRSINFRQKRLANTKNSNFIASIIEEALSGQLEFAVAYGDIELVEDLLKAGANPNFMVDRDYPLINYALLEIEDVQKEYSIIKLLLEYGANVNALDTHGSNLLFDIVPRDKVDIARLLIKYGIDVNHIGSEGYTPLIQAAHFHALDTTKLLLENKANVNARDREGDTALIHAVHNQNYYENSAEEQKTVRTIVDILLSHDADVSVKDKEGKSALDYAKKFRFNDALNILVRHAENNV